MSEDVVKNLKTRKYLLQLDESTLRNSAALLISYIRYVDKGNFAEEMLFCKSLQSAIASKDIYTKLKLFCEEQNEDHGRLILHIEIRWLLKENCLKRVIAIFDIFSGFSTDEPEMKKLLTVNGKAFLSYLDEDEKVSH
ncbi:SCAN domain-containing protein 3 [Trichonephila clavata]|uniref:SCAN domain-containing protein 3 n=1 Tax=Trichonephila clavata TaxID=2740835 RepID=A0A8X6FRV1_TRICU|nr:SCAN domain-containing protein 3 [Trichonephila clavata]